MYGNPAFDCAGAQLHAVCRQLATVVTVDGVIDDTNIERVTALALRFVLAEKAFVLDLSGVNSFSAHSVSLLSAVDESCFHVRSGVVADHKRAGAAGGTHVRGELPDSGRGARRPSPVRRQHRRTPSTAAPADQENRIAERSITHASRYSLARIPAGPSARAGKAGGARRPIAHTLGYAVDRRRHERDRVSARRLVAKPAPCNDHLGATPRAMGDGRRPRRHCGLRAPALAPDRIGRHHRGARAARGRELG